jgi:hypothetical protein
MRAPVNLKGRLLHRWTTLSVVWSIFWFGGGTLDILLRSGCHFGKCIFNMEEIRPIVILAPTLAALPWVLTVLVIAVLWFLRWTWRASR